MKEYDDTIQGDILLILHIVHFKFASVKCLKIVPESSLILHNLSFCLKAPVQNPQISFEFYVSVNRCIEMDDTFTLPRNNKKLE